VKEMNDFGKVYCERWDQTDPYRVAGRTIAAIMNGIFL
jgi:hypothetical protein